MKVLILGQDLDFLVEDSIMVELKALIKLEEVHLAQAMNYCQVYNLPIGLLINFGSKSLEFKRVYNLNHPENLNYKSNLPNSQEKYFNPGSCYFYKAKL